MSKVGESTKPGGRLAFWGDWVGMEEWRLPANIRGFFGGDENVWKEMGVVAVLLCESTKNH